MKVEITPEIAMHIYENLQLGPLTEDFVNFWNSIRFILAAEQVRGTGKATLTCSAQLPHQREWFCGENCAGR